ncbi:MAG TPA: pectate lyase [Thermoplasmata archaeon]
MTLYDWVKAERFLGWDPYDALNSELSRRITLGIPALEAVVTQFNRTSLVNLRPYLGVQKSIDTKGTAIFAQAFAQLYELTEEARFKTDLKWCIELLEERSLRNRYGFDCWSGHCYSHRLADLSMLDAQTAETVATSEVVMAFLDSIPIIGDDEQLRTIESAVNFLMDRMTIEKNDEMCFRYSTANESRIVINATAIAISALSRASHYIESDRFRPIIRRSVEFILRMQDEDGSWPYSVYDDGRTRSQTDFHQGFLIDGLIDCLPLFDGAEKARICTCIENAARFYATKQFLSDGRGYYRYPRFYPTDIHNQAQGMITLCKLTSISQDYARMANQVAIWTICNMQDSTGYFWYRKGRLMTNKIKFMRWGQAWMMLALAKLLSNPGRV